MATSITVAQNIQRGLSCRQDAPFSVAFIDLDNFKSANDAHSPSGKAVWTNARRFALARDNYGGRSATIRMTGMRHRRVAPIPLSQASIAQQ